MTSSSFREVVSAFFSAYECSLSNALISIRACGSSGLNYRHARICVFTSLRACACVCAWTLRTCSLFLFVYVTLKFRVAKYLVSSRTGIPSFLCHNDHFIFSLSFEQRNTSDAFNRSFLTFLSCIYKFVWLIFYLFGIPGILFEFRFSFFNLFSNYSIS